MQSLKHSSPLEADPSGLCEEPTVETKKALWLHGMVTAFPWHFHSAAKIGHDFTELTWLNHHFHLDFLPETISQIGLWQARRRTCSLSIWRHDTTPQDFLASASENRCRAQAFRNAQFEPLPEPSRNKWCWHVLTCLTMSIYIYILICLTQS